ncbi:hypothetical protein AGABI1DRAFT_132267 [Agaricus bisporus var. burnettii JB137-S8]|uniref:BTB domain-containing protein n=1 Tax=Agaricus bisporus var. burnettii (strain JB137-S8 / ATCC MYA-4627 / FGSC 10392) TaxID=597362 RepID=K5WJ94_AGABU|nr:uncharacterized protein AGABI1DRAFT_132267 [Agaricus bisporus var. burnettii JB137-S8]EKM75366.1 hypothetical protein AGABI1DRAFT_132267 [Agaricus bisporus var. burnettii JB137-S8]
MDKTSQPSTPVRAESFYFDDDPMAIFLVDNQLFKVHRHFFIEGSQIFRDMFSQGKTCEEAEGMSDDKPILLPNVTVKEFKTLLRYFYAMKSPTSNKKLLADVFAFEQDEKLALLSVAHQFCFDQIYEYILGEIEPGTFSVVDRVRLGDKYGLKDWISSAYKVILERTADQKLSQEEAHALGFDRAVEVLEAKISILHEVHGDHPKKFPPSTPCDNPFQSAFSSYSNRRPCQCCARWMNDISTQNPQNPVSMENAVARAVEKLLL